MLSQFQCGMNVDAVLGNYECDTERCMKGLKADSVMNDNNNCL